MRRKTVPCFLALAAGILTAYAFGCRRWLIAASVLLVLSGFYCLNNSHDDQEKHSLKKEINSRFLRRSRSANRSLLFACIIFFAAGVWLMVIAGTAPQLRECDNTELSGVVSSVFKKAEEHYMIEISHSKGRTIANYYSVIGEKGYSSKEGSQGKNAVNDKIEDVSDLVGRQILAKGDISYPDQAQNPGCFDYRLYLKTKKTDTVMTCRSFETGSVKDRFMHFLSAWRGDYEKLLQANLGEREYQIISAMLFGDKSSMEEELYESFQKNGTAHILAVSGLHIGMIYALFSLAIGGRRKIWTNIVIALLLAAYAALAGFSPSVVRAVIMILLHIVSRLAHYRYDLVSAGCVTAGLMLIWSPYSLFSAGFQMSFLAVMIMGFLMPLFDNDIQSANNPSFSSAVMAKISGKEKNKLVQMIKRLVIPPFVIQTGMLPLTVYQFNYLPFISVFANIPVVFLAGLIVPAGVVMFVLCGLGIMYPGGFVSGSFTQILGIITEMMIKVNDLFYSDGIASPDVASPPLWTVLVLYALLFFVCSEWARIKWHRGSKAQWTLAASAAVAAALSFGAVFGNDFVDADCVFVDVGQGACVHLRAPGAGNYLFDGGGKPSFGQKKNGSGGFDVGKKILKPYLLKNGVRKVDIAFVTHLDADHYKGIASICRLGMVKKLGLHECLRDEEEKVIKETGMERSDVLFFATGDRLKGRDLEIDILAPAGSPKDTANDDNENSMVARAVFGKTPLFGDKSEVSVLITGDIDEKAEKRLCFLYSDGELDSDIIAVPHHGSRYSSSQELIDAVSPAAAVIQVGKKNMYGHPADEVIRRYQSYGSIVFRTDHQGAVGVFGKRINVMH